MNILHLSAVKNWGGGENHIENLCRELGSIAPKVKNIIFCNKKGQLSTQLKDSNIQVFTGTLRFKMDPFYFLGLIQVCKKEKIDLIHIHDTTALTLAVMADHFHDLPPFILSKKTSFPIKPRKQTLFKYNYPKIKKILCVSQATVLVTRKSVTDLKKIECIYHGTNINSEENKNIFNLRERLDLNANTVVIGNIANHIRAKNLENYISVVKELVHHRNFKNLHFVQIGAFTNRTQALKQLVKENDLKGHITFLDYFHQASGLIPQFDISLLTSQSEGLPQFIYESLLHETPVVSTDVGGIPEIITHNENGLLAPAHDPVALADYLQLLIDQPQKRKEFTKSSRTTIKEGFTTKQMAQKTLEIYKEVLNGHN